MLFNEYKKSLDKRVAATDLVKLVAILLVIVGHCLSKYVVGCESTFVFNLIWITQMPLFMFASGLVSPKPERINTFGNLCYRYLKHLIMLVYPCLTFLLFSSLTGHRSILISIEEFFLNPDTNLWFLWVLFLMRIIFEFGLFVANKFKFRSNYLIPIAFLLLVSLLVMILVLLKVFDGSFLGLKLLAYYSVFFVAGYLFKIFIESELYKKLVMKILQWVVLVITLSLALFCCIYFDSIYSFSDSNPLYLGIRVIASFSSLYCFLVLINFISKTVVFKKISFFGRFTLETYYLHIVVLRYLNTELFSNQWLNAFAYSSLVLIIVTLILIALYFIPFSHLVIFGKTYSFYKFEKKLPKVFQ